MESKSPSQAIDMMRNRNMAHIDHLTQACEHRVQRTTGVVLNTMLGDYRWRDGDSHEWALMLNVGMRALAMLMVAEPNQGWDVEAVSAGLRKHFEFFSRPSSRAPSTGPDEE